MPLVTSSFLVTSLFTQIPDLLSNAPGTIGRIKHVFSQFLQGFPGKHQHNLPDLGLLGRALIEHFPLSTSKAPREAGPSAVVQGLAGRGRSMAAHRTPEA